MTEENKKANVSTELQMSSRALEAAKRNAAAADFATATNRLYYATYHAALAVLLSEGLEPKTHRGLTHLLKLHFVKKGLLPDWVEPAFSKIQLERELVDYEPGYSIDAEGYGRLSAEVQRLLRELEGLLRARGLIA